MAPESRLSGSTAITAAATRPKRVLHVFAVFDRGGAETWLMDVMRHSRRDEMMLDACLTQPQHGRYEDEFLALGGRIHRCLLGRNPLAFGRALYRLLRQEAYDVVHTHFYYFSGYILRIAARAGVPQRVAHNHPAEDPKPASTLRRLYSALMLRWTRRYGTDFIGPSRASLEHLWGPAWESNPRNRVVYNGISVGRFSRDVDRAQVRRELDLPPGARIVLNVARFAAHKRQAFLVDIARELVPKDPSVHFVLIGDGDLRDDVMQRAREAGLDGRFRFIRGEPDIDRFWLAADAFAFPSVNEGFGIVIAEAAAAGLPVVACDIVGVREAAVACHDGLLLPADTDPLRWVAALQTALERGPLELDRRRAWLESFPFTIEASVRSLKELYGVYRAVQKETQPSGT